MLSFLDPKYSGSDLKNLDGEEYNIYVTVPLSETQRGRLTSKHQPSLKFYGK